MSKTYARDEIESAIRECSQGRGMSDCSACPLLHGGADCAEEFAKFAAALLRQQAAPAEAGPMPWVELALRLLELQPLDYRFRAKGAASNWASDLAQDTDLLIAEYRKRQAGA